MRFAELLLWGLVGWTAIGLVGSLLSGVRRGNWPKARRGFATIAAAWTAYLLTLLLVSHFARQRRIPPGEAQCFGDLCFRVDGVQQLTAFAGRGLRGDRLLRVRVRVSNRGHSGAARDSGIRAYLLDDHGGRWGPVPGLTGVSLRSPVSEGGQLLSEIIFAVPQRVGPVNLVLSHGRWQPGTLTLGDGDSLLHLPNVMRMETP